MTEKQPQLYPVVVNTSCYKFVFAMMELLKVNDNERLGTAMSHL